MNTIDQRILIPASPEIIWDYLSDVTKNPEWQQDCRQVSFLTSIHKGPGTRWRSTTSGRSEQVIEITAWYERLGYEYQIVDGVSFKENKGRIRLQDTPEGTIVQWTFHYELSGVFGGLRNTLSTRRNEENKIVESLWALWRNISQQKEQMAVPYTAKSLMQDAPDVEARAQYIPRHPSLVKDKQPSEVMIPEPPIAEDDTRPRPELSTSEVTAANVTEPDFLSDFSEEKHTTDETVTTSSVHDVLKDTETWLAATEADVYQDRDDDPVVAEPLSPDLSAMPPVDPKADTGTISVFDLFGLPKPSETQELLPITTPMVSPPTLPSSPKRSSRRTGLRRFQRANLINVRNPQ